MKSLTCLSLVSLVAYCACADLPDCGPGAPLHSPHPTDCNKYYICDNGEPVLQRCAPGLWWSEAIEGCDLPEHTNCAADGSSTTGGTTAPPIETTTGGGSSTPPIETTTTGGGTSTPPIETTTSGGSSTPPIETSTGGGSSTIDPNLPDCHGETDTLLPHPTDCTKFYKCLNGVPFIQNCPPGLWWHQEILGCDYPDVSGCTPGSTSATSPTTGPPTEPTSGSTTVVIPTEPPSSLPDRCPEGGTGGEDIRIPFPTSCRFYLRCSNSSAETSTYVCPPYDHFSPTKRTCLLPEVAGCAFCPTIDVEGQEVRLPHESDCHLYYLCEGGKRNLFQCRSDWHFNSSTRECMEQADAKCTL